MVDGSERFVEALESSFAPLKHTGGVVNKYELAEALRDAIKDAQKPLVQRMDDLNQRMDNMNERMGKIGAALNQKMDDTNERMGKMDATLSQIKDHLLPPEK